MISLENYGLSDYESGVYSDLLEAYPQLNNMTGNSTLKKAVFLVEKKSLKKGKNMINIKILGVKKMVSL